MKKKRVRVFFNASVILAGLHSPNGASGKLLSWVKKQNIIGIISEIVWNEVMKNTQKLGLSQEKTKEWIQAYFSIVSAPEQHKFSLYNKIAIDSGDIHLFVSAESIQSDYLVSLDKKHVLKLQKQISFFRIVSPAELIERLM